nr:hypothetical protein N8D75_03625 [Curtobacterium flaccumfaciens]
MSTSEKLVRPGTGVVGGQVLLCVVLPAVFVEDRRADHLHAERRGEVVEERRVLRLEVHRDAVVTVGFHRCDVSDHVRGATVDGGAALERVDDRFRGERRAVVEGDVGTQGEVVGQAVVGHRPLRRELRHDLRGVGAVAVGHEALVGVLDDVETWAVVVGVRVRWRRVRPEVDGGEGVRRVEGSCSGTGRRAGADRERDARQERGDGEWTGDGARGAKGHRTDLSGRVRGGTCQ